MQQVAQVGLHQGRRPEFQQQHAHLGQRAPVQAAQLLQIGQRPIPIPFPERGQHVGDDRRRPERLADGVVQVAGQPLPLLLHALLLFRFLDALPREDGP